MIQDPDEDKPAKSNVIDLMAALKKSLGDDAGNDNQGAAAKPAAKKPAARKPAAAKKTDAPAKKTAAGGRKR